ncbi:MAG: DUF4920 domain-containing protein [bacterium]
MKLISVFMLTIFLLTFSFAGTKNYGKKLTVKEKTKISDILAEPEKFAGKKVLVEGTVAEVCEMQGCWIKIKSSENSDQIRFKVNDGEIIFPKNASGKTALAQGIVTVKTKSKEELIAEGEHFAQDAGKTFDPSTVTGPQTVVTIKGEGAVLR